jgi:hypothetical protein
MYVRVLAYSLSIAARGVRNEKLYLRDPSLLEIRFKWFRNWYSGGIINLNEYEELQWLVARLPLTPWNSKIYIFKHCYLLLRIVIRKLYCWCNYSLYLNILVLPCLIM